MSIQFPKRQLTLKDQLKEWNQIVLEIKDQHGNVIADIGLDPVTARRVGKQITEMAGKKGLLVLPGRHP